MSWFKNDSRKERHPSSVVDMPPTMARSGTPRAAGNSPRADAAANAQVELDARRAADERRAAAALERALRRDETETDVEDAVVKAERSDDAPAQRRDDVQARQRDDAQALRRGDARAEARDDVPTQPGDPTQAQQPGDAHAPSDNDEQLPPLFNADVAQTFRARWDAAQISFVDNPRQAVEQADELVAQMIKSLARSVADERARLDAQMNETGSTEHLRVALRRYRSFFQRLLTL